MRTKRTLEEEASAVRNMNCVFDRNMNEIALEKAIEKLNEAWELIYSVVGDDGNTQAYLLNGLSHMANDDGNPYDLSVPKLIKEVKEGKQWE